MRSNAEDRQAYLLRPDYGRHLHDGCRAHLLYELAIVIAAQRHALPLRACNSPA